MVVTRGKSKKGQTNANNNAPSPALPAVGNLRDRPKTPTYNEAIQEGMPYINPILEEKNPGSKPNRGAKPAKKPAGGKTTKKKPTIKKSKTKEPTTKKATTTKGKRNSRERTTKIKVVHKQAKKVSTNLDNSNNETTKPSASSPSISSLSLQLQVVELKIDKMYKLQKSLIRAKEKRRKSNNSTKSKNRPRHYSRKKVVHIPASHTSEKFSDVEVFDVKKPSLGQYLPPKKSEYSFLCVHVSFLYLLINVL